jgi:hypothetical protein|tara:strand:- start:591 stop:794 length:204 start_codon:yes stop_codon:yes gene_type:complete
MDVQYDDHGQRMTDCCGSYSTWFAHGLEPEVLCCKKCYREVSLGEGDGNEFRKGITAEKYYKEALAS